MKTTKQNGVLEHWSDEVVFATTPSLHHSITPLLRFSIT